MMNYSLMGQNPYLYPSYFANTMQQTYGNPVPQQQQQQQNQNNTQQQSISTQPPILQPRINSYIIPISNKEEATAAQIDLINGTPSFFYNKGKNEIYLKQFDTQNGTAIFKTYGELQPTEEPLNNVSTQTDINRYDEELTYIKNGIDGLYRMLSDIQKQNEEDIEEEKKVKKK